MKVKVRPKITERWHDTGTFAWRDLPRETPAEHRQLLDGIRHLFPQRVGQRREIPTPGFVERWGELLPFAVAALVGLVAWAVVWMLAAWVA